MCNCSSFRENCVTHAQTHTHRANYNLPPASRAGDEKNVLCDFFKKIFCQFCHLQTEMTELSRQLGISFNTKQISFLSELFISYAIIKIK